MRHPQLVEEKGEDIRIFRDVFGEGGAHAVACGRAELHEDEVGGGVGLLQTGGHFREFAGLTRPSFSPVSSTTAG
jgi:hypothetical protein